MYPIVRESPLIETILRDHSQALKEDLPMYRGHCYRVLNHVLLLQEHEANMELLQVATAFHDLGIWTHETMDYFNPSFALAQTYCRAEKIEINFPELESIIKEHHKLSSLERVTAAEFFRRADLIDLSFGYLRQGLPREFIDANRECWPYMGFQRMIFRKVFRHAIGNLSNPFPMLKL